VSIPWRKPRWNTKGSHNSRGYRGGPLGCEAVHETDKSVNLSTLVSREGKEVIIGRGHSGPLTPSLLVGVSHGSSH
jgi:hypothetical protein